MTVNFRCTLCEDAGLVHPRNLDNSIDYSRLVPCQCKVEQEELRRSQRYAKYCRLPEGTDRWTFDTFNTYDDPNLQKASDLSHRLAEGDSNILWLTLLSEVDRGKTHLAVAICRYWMSKGKVARFTVASDLLDELQESQDMEGPESFHWKRKMYGEVALLVIDDLGMGKYTDWRREQIFSIINRRANNKLPLVVTSNNEVDKIFGDKPEYEFDNARIASRLQRESWCHTVIIGAMEHRLRG